MAIWTIKISIQYCILNHHLSSRVEGCWANKEAELLRHCLKCVLVARNRCWRGIVKKRFCLFFHLDLLLSNIPLTFDPVVSLDY